MKELETNNELLEEEREWERKMKSTELQNDDVRFQPTSARDKSPFNWTPKEKWCQGTARPEDSTTFYHQTKQQLAPKQLLN